MERRKEGNYEDKILTWYRVKDEKGRGRSRKEEGKVRRNIGRRVKLARSSYRAILSTFVLAYFRKQE